MEESLPPAPASQGPQISQEKTPIATDWRSAVVKQEPGTTTSDSPYPQNSQEKTPTVIDGSSIVVKREPGTTPPTSQEPHISQKKTPTATNGSIVVKREPGDGQESIAVQYVDDDVDEDQRPLCLPEIAPFFQHDDRTTDDYEAPQTIKRNKKKRKLKKKTRHETNEEERWRHDLFDDMEQAPKSTAELVSIYGYDVRAEDAPPIAKRRRRYSRSTEDRYRNSSTRQRSLPESITPPFTKPHSNFNKNEVSQTNPVVQQSLSHQNSSTTEVPQIVLPPVPPIPQVPVILIPQTPPYQNAQMHPSTMEATQITPPPVPPNQQVPIIPILQTPQFALSFAQAPPPFGPQHTPHIIIYMPNQPQFQGYQDYQQQDNPVTPPKTSKAKSRASTASKSSNSDGGATTRRSEKEGRER